jgi:hypothetical protein
MRKNTKYSGTLKGYLASGIVLIAAASIFTISSCKPEDKTKTAPAKRDYQLTSGTTFDATRVDADIKSFYQKMKSLQGGSSTENITVDNALFLIEGTYNKYVAERQFNCDVIPYEFTVKVPANSDGTLNMKKVSEAFYTIKSNMLAKKNELGGSSIGVETFDMTVAEKPTGVDGQGYAIFGVITIFKRPNPGFPIDMTQWCNDNFHEAADHVWRAETQSDPTIIPGLETNGQATIDHANKIVVPGTIDNTFPGAASSLRAKGVGNYQGFYCKSMMCGYFVNIDFAYNYYAAPAGAASNQYVAMGVPDYTNVGTWVTNQYKTGAADPYNVYKKWLTTPMMNYYLAGIPAIITANIVPGKTFANFHITTNTNFQPTSVPYDIPAHWYKIYSGNFVATPGGDCTGKLELGYL